MHYLIWSFQGLIRGGEIEYIQKKINFDIISFWGVKGDLTLNFNASKNEFFI